MFPVCLCIVLFNNFWGGVKELAQSIDIQIFADEHIVYFLYFFLEFTL